MKGNKIINFHDVSDIAWFEDIIIFLKTKYKLRQISDLEDFYNGNSKITKSCFITVDDGDKTFYDIIYPVLKKHAVPAALFVSPEICSKGSNFWFQEVSRFNQDELKSIIKDYLGPSTIDINNYPPITILKNCAIKDIWNMIEEYRAKFPSTINISQNMTVEQLKEVEADGLITIGAHTINHPLLANETDEVSKKEIINSVKELEDLIGHSIDYFAYPNGVPNLDFGEREINYLKQSNIKLAFSTQAQNISIKDEVLAIPRFGITHGNLKFIRAKLLLGKYWLRLRELKTKSEATLRAELNSICKL